MQQDVKRRKFFALCKTKGISNDDRKQLIYSQTEGRTDSLSEVKDTELDAMLRFLDPKQQAAQTAKKPVQNDQNNQLRRTVIYHMRMMGYEANGKADMPRIEAWVLKYYPANKPFNDLKYLDLVDLVTQVKQMYKKHLKQI